MSAQRRVSALEQTYGVFFEGTIAAAGSAAPAGPLMRDLNKICTITAGIAEVLRIVGGNTVLEDEFDPDDPKSPPPLSRTSVSMLTAMSAEVCTMIRDHIANRASDYNSRGQS